MYYVCVYYVSSMNEWMNCMYAFDKKIMWYYVCDTMTMYVYVCTRHHVHPYYVRTYTILCLQAREHQISCFASYSHTQKDTARPKSFHRMFFRIYRWRFLVAARGIRRCIFWKPCKKTSCLSTKQTEKPPD